MLVLPDGVDEGVAGYSLGDVVNYAVEKGVPVFTIAIGDIFILVRTPKSV